MSTKLSTSEQKRFTACKEQISSGLQTCFDTGLALTEIRDSKLYREDFDTFVDFCEQTYQLGKTHAYRLIESAEIKTSPIGGQIVNERQARAIAQVPEKDRVKVLKKAEKTGSITAESITEAARDYSGAYSSAAPEKEVITLDKEGRAIPSEILEDWNRAAAVGAKLRACASEIKVTVERGLSDKDIIFAEITNPTISEASGLHYTLSQLQPHSVCPSCHGKQRKNCQLCRKRGFISKYLFNSPAVSAETKAILKKVAGK